MLYYIIIGLVLEKLVFFLSVGTILKVNLVSKRLIQAINVGFVIFQTWRVCFFYSLHILYLLTSLVFFVMT